MEPQKRQKRRISSDYFRVKFLKNIMLKKYKAVREALALRAAIAYEKNFVIPSANEEIEEKNCGDKSKDIEEFVPWPPIGQKRKPETIMSPTVKKCRRQLFK